MIAAIVFFSITILFDPDNSRKKIRNISNPGFEEMTLEPLYYAFNDEKIFDSSLNGAVDVKSSSSLRTAVKKRWYRTLILIGCTVVLLLFRFALPKSERMDRFDKALKRSFNTETEYIQDDEVQTLPDDEP